MWLLAALLAALGWQWFTRWDAGVRRFLRLVREDGRPGEALELLATLGPVVAQRPEVRLARLTALLAEGRIDEARTVAREAAAAPLPECDPRAAVVEALTELGLLPEALALGRDIPPAPSWQGPEAHLRGLLRLRIQLAMAGAHGGALEQAVAELESLDGAPGHSPFTHALLGLSRARLLAEAGFGEGARASLRGVSRAALGPLRAASLAHVRGLAALALGELEEAEREASEAIRLAGASSVGRDALLLKARIAHAGQRPESARALARQAAAHPIAIRPGESQLLLGALELELGQPEAARAAFLAALEQEPHAASARKAEAALEALGRPPPPTLQ